MKTFYTLNACPLPMTWHPGKAAPSLYDSVFGCEGHVAVDRNTGPVYNTLLLRLFSLARYFKCLSQKTVPHITRPFRQSDCTVKLLP